MENDWLVYTHDPYAGITGGYSPPNAVVNPINIANADGSGRSQIVGGIQMGATCPCYTSDPALSPDGTKVAFALTDSTNTNIWVLELWNNTNPYQISDATDSEHGYYEPAWSPSGTRVLARFDSTTADEDELRGINVGTPGIVTLHEDEDGGINNATYSPDGEHIAFADEGHLYEMASDGTDVQEVLGPVETENALCGLEIYGGPSICHIQNPVYSPSGDHFAFEAGGQIFTADRSGYNASQVTCTQGGHKPAWSGDGRHIAYHQWRATSGNTLSQIRSIKPGGSDGHLLIPDDGDTRYTDPSFRQPTGTLEEDPEFTPSHCPDTETLLYRYSPELRYDPQENYFADSAAAITDNWYEGVSNKLVDTDGGELAWSEPGHSWWRLTLSNLDNTYPPGFASSGTDWIDEDNGDYSGDAYRLHNAGYGDQVYGRAVRDENGKYWLQYWFFYYYNDFAVAGVGTHEGDWEMIQIGLDEDDEPSDVTYAQHTFATSCDWDEVETAETYDGPVPVVYVAWQSHGSHPRAARQTGSGPNETSNGGPHVRPTTEIIYDDRPGWVRWPGHWGNSRGGGLNSASPRTPSGQDHWKDPAEFDDGALPCESTPVEKRVVERPRTQVPAPKITARQAKGGVKVYYRFNRRVARRSLARLKLFVSVRTRRANGPAQTRGFRVRRRKASFFMRTRIARTQRHKVIVSAIDRRNGRSRLVHARVKR